MPIKKRSGEVRKAPITITYPREAIDIALGLWKLSSDDGSVFAGRMLINQLKRGELGALTTLTTKLPLPLDNAVRTETEQMIGEYLDEESRQNFVQEMAQLEQLHHLVKVAFITQLTSERHTNI